jgi:hypothetical protein
MEIRMGYSGKEFVFTTTASLKEAREIVLNIGAHNKISAIKVFRDKFGAGLRDAKEIIEYAIDHPGMTTEQREWLEGEIATAKEDIASLHRTIDSLYTDINNENDDIERWNNELQEGE